MGGMMLGYFLILSVFSAVTCRISDLRLCGDPECKEPVSKGVTVLKYPSSDKDILSFTNNAEVLIYSKGAGTRRDLWGVEIQGKRGYAPHKYIRELKIYKSKLKYEVPTESDGVKDNKDGKQIPSEESPRKEPKTNENDPSDLEKTLKVPASTEDVGNSTFPDKENTQQKSSQNTVEEDASQKNKNEDKTGESSLTQEVKDEAVEKAGGDEESRKDENEVEEKEEEEEDDEEEEDEEETIVLETEEDIKDGKTPESVSLKSSKETEGGEPLPAEPHGEADSVPLKESEEEEEEESLPLKPNEKESLPLKKSEEEEEEEKEKSKPLKTNDEEESLPLKPSEDSVSLKPSEETESVSLKPSVDPEYVSVKQNEVKNEADVISIEPSSVAFEVIDGTTLYFDEDVDTTPTTTREPPSSSPVLDDPAASSVLVHAMFHHPRPLTGATNTPNANGEASESVKSEIGSNDKMESLDQQTDQTITDDHVIPSDTVEPLVSTNAEEVVTEGNQYLTNEDTNSLTQSHSEDGETVKHTDDNNIKNKISGEGETLLTTEESENEFGAPKVETVISNSAVPPEKPEKPVENEGFFASWFGSSEDPSELDDDDDDDNDNDDDDDNNDDKVDPSESESTVDDTVDLESKFSDDLKNSKPEVSDNDIDSPSDNISIPLNDNEDPDIVVQVSSDTDESEIASNSTPLNQYSLKSNSSVSPDMDSSGDVPLPSPDDTSSTHVGDSTISDANSTISDATEGSEDLGSIANDTAESSEEDTIDYLDNRREEPGPSTARPMYAEPEPTTQSFSHSNVDPDELARLAGSGETGDDYDDKEIQESVQESLVGKFLKASHSLLPEGMAFGVEAEMVEPEMSHGALVFLSIVVFTIIIIYAVHLIMMKFSRENPILEALNTMDREKRLLQNENASLHEELCKAQAELKGVGSQITVSCGEVNDLDSQLEIIKNEHAAEMSRQEEKISQLEHELEEATNNSLEMHKMLSEMLSAQKDTSTFQASVDHLQEMLDGQQEKVETLNSDLALKTRLNEELHMELSASREQAAKLDSQVQQLTQSLKELSGSKEEINQQLLKDLELVKELQDVNESLSKQSVEYDEHLSDLKQELKTLQATISNLRENLECKDSELKVAKECLKQLQLTSDNSSSIDDKLSSLFDAITIKAELQRVSSERINLEDQLKESEMAQKNLEDTMSSIQTEVTEIRAMHEEALREKQDALSKLAVLTQYFEEKEAQLTKELESQEGLRVDAEGTAASVSHKIHNYQLEVASYKAQVQSLQKELQDQEKSYKTQLDTCEKKAHDNWLQARAAERKHEEQRQENSQLRNRLLMIQKEREDLQGNILKPTAKRLDANGRLPSPGIEGEVMVDGEHSESPHHPLPSVLPMMLPPGAPLPPGIPPPHGYPGVPPPPPPPGMPHGVPPFHPGEFPPFMRPPLPPLPGDRRLPPAGGMSSPPYRRSGSPLYSHRNDRYSPSSDHSHLSDHHRHYSPPPLRHRPSPSPDLHLRRNHSPDRRSDRLRSPDRRSDRVRASPEHHSSTRRTPDSRLDRCSPDRPPFSSRLMDGYHRHKSSPHDYYDQSDYNSDDFRLHQTPPNKGKKTSTPLSSDRWRNDV